MPAKHSWFFSRIANDKVPGVVPLTVHGKTVVENNSIIMDGLSSWFDGYLDEIDCLLAPENCPDGLSVAFKMMYKSLIVFPEERYIFDTGVLSKGLRGIAIYIQEGQLFCVLRTMSGQWKVSHVFIVKSTICL